MNARRSGAATLRAPIRRAWTWWLDGLTAALPTWVLAVMLGTRRRVQVAIDDRDRLVARIWPSHAGQPVDGCAFEDGAWRPETNAKRVLAAARSAHIVLQCPIRLRLTKIVDLPAAAAENLAQAVEFGLSGWAPFAPQDVLVSASILEARAETVRVELNLATRAALAPVLGRCEAAGLSVRSVAFGAGSGAVAAIGGPFALRQARTGARIDLALAAAAGLLAVALVVALHVRSSRAIGAVGESLRLELGHLSRQAKIEAEIAVLEKDIAAIAQAVAGRRSMAALTDEIAAGLSDADELLELIWTGDRGRLVVRTARDDGNAAFLAEATTIRATTNQRILELTGARVTQDIVSADQGTP